MDCQATTCPLYEICQYSNPTECDLKPLFPISISNSVPWAPLYVKFSYLDEWRHIPLDEKYPIGTVDDFEGARDSFRERHGSKGSLVVFYTSDQIEWKNWGEIQECAF